MPKKYIRISFLLVYGLFIIQWFYFALSTPQGMAPDESFHFLQVLGVSDWSSIFPTKDDLDVRGYLHISTYPAYYWIMWIFLKLYTLLAVSGESSEVELFAVVRIFNLLFILAYLYYLKKLAELILKEPELVILTLLIQVNILMFVFLSASISYDNSVNAAAAASLYYVFAGIISEKKEYLIYFTIAVAIGLLTKATFWPLATALFAIASYHWRKDLLRLNFRRLLELKTFPKKQSFLLLVAISLIGLNMQAHFGNIVKYGTVKPHCRTLYTQEECLSSVVQKKYQKIRDELTTPNEARLDPIRYFAVWMDYMIEKSIGIFGYSSYYPDKQMLGAVELLLFFWLMWVARKIDFTNAVTNYLIIIFASYLLIVFYYANYSFYSAVGIMPRYTFVAIQGRYLFPVYPVLLVLFVKYAMEIGNSSIRRVVYIFLVIFFLFLGCFQHFVNPKGIAFSSNEELQEKHKEHVLQSQQFIR